MLLIISIIYWFYDYIDRIIDCIGHVIDYIDYIIGYRIAGGCADISSICWSEGR